MRLSYDDYAAALDSQQELLAAWSLCRLKDRVRVAEIHQGLMETRARIASFNEVPALRRLVALKRSEYYKRYQCPHPQDGISGK